MYKRQGQNSPKADGKALFIGHPDFTDSLEQALAFISQLPLVSQNDVDRLRKYDLHTGDIVFSRVGSVDRRCV